MKEGFSNIYKFSQIPLHIFSKDGKSIAEYGGTSASEYDKNKINLLKNLLRNQDFVSLPYDAPLPVFVFGCRGKDYDFILGPFAYGKLDSFECRRLIKKEKMGSFPERSIPDVLTIASLLFELYSDADYSSDDLYELLYEASASSDFEKSLTHETVRQLDSFEKNHTLLEEDDFFLHITNGDTEILQKNYDSLRPSYPVIINNILKNEEYMAVLIISFGWRAAIRGGLASAEAFLMNDLYLQQLASCKNIKDIHSLVKKSIISSSEQVRRKKREKGLNYYVEECKKYIISKRFEKLDLQTIADEIGISKEYLQKLFKHYEGIPITEYILNVKLEAAQNMLKYSDKKVSDIADYLCFGTLSYFSDIFKRKIGCSPNAYRKNNRPSGF